MKFYERLKEIFVWLLTSYYTEYKTTSMSNLRNPRYKKAVVVAPVIVPPVDPRASLPDRFKNHHFNYNFIDKLPHTISHPNVVKSLSLIHRLRFDVHKAQKPQEMWKNPEKFTIPSKYSMADKVQKILNQGQIGACVAHSASQALHLIMNRNDSSRYRLSKLASKSPLFWSSRLFIYDNARRIDGTPLTEDQGTTNHSACLALEKYKVCPEDLWPYESVNLSLSPPSDAYVYGNKFSTFDYSPISEQDPESFKSAIANGYPVMIGIVVFSSFVKSGTDGGSGNAPMPHSSELENPLGGHSLLVVGYDDEAENEDGSKGRVIGVNHWGNEWGNNGMFTLPYDFVFGGKYAGDFIAIKNFA